MDQITKILIRLNFTRSESIDIFGSIMRFTYTENPGAAFGIYWQELLAILSIDQLEDL